MATLPGVRAPSRTGQATLGRASSRNVGWAYGGSAASSAAMPNVACITLRIAGVRLAALTISHDDRDRGELAQLVGAR